MIYLGKVLIVEDNPEVIDAVSLALQIRWPSVKIISSARGTPAPELIEKESPDLMILDLYLPDISGYNVLKQVRLFSNIPVIILTVRSEEVDVIKGLEIGADEYIIKPFRQLELIARVKALLRRRTQITEEGTITCGNYILDTNERILLYKNKRYYLSGSEIHILRRLMGNAGHAVSHNTLAEELWGEDYPESNKNLKTYIRRLRTKIEQDSYKPKLILTRQGVGYYWNIES